MGPSPDMAMLALLITLSRQYTHSSVKASTPSSPCQPLGQSGNAKPPSLTTSGGVSKTHSPKLPPTRHSHSTPLQLSPQPPPLPPLLLSTLCPCCILSPPTHGLGSHPPNEERPLSWSLLQLWQTRPHHKGLPGTTCPECPEH